MSKPLAGREKDVEFVRGMVNAGVTTEAAIRALADELPTEEGSLLELRLQVCRRSP